MESKQTNNTAKKNTSVRKNNNNNKKNSGVYIIDRNELDCDRLNEAVNKRRYKYRMEQEKAIYNKLMSEYIKNKWKAYNNDTLYFIIVRVVVLLVSVYMMYEDMLDPFVALVVSLFCLVTVCIRFGVWFGVSKWKI